MRKFICFSLSVLLIFSFIGCKTKETSTSRSNASAEKISDITSDSDYSIEYIGNKRTMKLHLPTCHTLPAEKNQVYFVTQDEAKGLFYEPCQNCMP